MRPLILSVMLLSTSWIFTSEAVHAEEIVAITPAANAVAQGQLVSLELIAAHREYQAAKLRMHEYRFVTLPQQQRLLGQKARLAKAELSLIKRRLRDYQPFLRVGDYSPVRTAAESHQLALLGVQQRLQQTKDDQRALTRLSRQQGQLYQLDLLYAATRMALAKGALASSLEK